MFFLGDRVEVKGKSGLWYIDEFLDDDRAYLINLNPDIPSIQAEMSDITLIGE